MPMALPRFEYRLLVSEAIGTAILLFAGLSIVIFNWGEGSVVARMIPSSFVRTLLTGFLFGCVGCLVTLSPVGKISGAHINPAVSVAFWLRGKMKTKALIGYIVAQMVGAAIGSFPLLLWGNQGKSIQYGITLPGIRGVGIAFLSEMVATSFLIIYLYVFIGRKRLRNYTPYGIPFLYGILNIFFAIPSGDSTNPARSFGPAVISQNFSYYWVYWAAPLTGVIIVTIFFKWKRIHRIYKMDAARVSYHEHPTPESLKTGGITATY
jgi:aquaporin Z